MKWVVLTLFVVFLLTACAPIEPINLPEDYPLAPELTGITGYINAEEGLQLEWFRGDVVLLEFWTYTCYSCQKSIPKLNEWHDTYSDQGLVMIGVHTPEFPVEHHYDNVVREVEKAGIKYRVVQDNDYSIWAAYQNRWWPRLVLIDKEGYIRYNAIGAGGYDRTEAMIQELLAE